MAASGAGSPSIGKCAPSDTEVFLRGGAAEGLVLFSEFSGFLYTRLRYVYIVLIVELDLFHQNMLHNWPLFPNHIKLYLSFFFTLLIVVFVSRFVVLVPDY